MQFPGAGLVDQYKNKYFASGAREEEAPHSEESRNHDGEHEAQGDGDGMTKVQGRESCTSTSTSVSGQGEAGALQGGKVEG